MNKVQPLIYVSIILLIAIFSFIILSKFSTKPASSPQKSINKQSTDKTTHQQPQDFKKLQIKTIQEGHGEREVKKGDTITVHYVGTLSNGKKFDSSYDRNKPFTFTVGQGMVIEGWEKGVLGMKVGEKRQLKIPSQMAYGEKGFPPTIPPKTGLIFEITLIRIN